MTIRPFLAAGALLALVPASARAQDALVAERPAAPATIPGRPTAADTAAPRPNGTVRVATAPSYRRDAARGALIGTGVGLVVGLLAYRNNERKCEGCAGNEAIPFLVTGAGSLVGAAAGSVRWLARPRAGAPARAASPR